ncbi:DMSO reductase anchor subunit [Rubricella aquisinus]|uniref:DMSO reductase anchor subunit n=1 Tax=Rubricella aquisinus TaxID=2028108 RepID=A0A840WYD4_9RHOB|nr:DmsC/YnfH family molybdoenzyme membrane anchor subunit [Rubricella aquisinus]MBB5514685.1 DMSO reductase anchor subunit [Rubricella aquisinus]
MHPAKSVIYFTVMSGLGYGLVIWLGIYALTDHNLPGGWNAGALTLALALVASGLISSTLHLGHPERAWRALSQWRTSWLSREGVAAIVTFIPLGLWWLSWMLTEPAAELKGALTDMERVFAILGMIGALVTVFTTSMIYASLKAVPSWHTIWTPLAYLILALYTGLLGFMAILGLAGGNPGVIAEYGLYLLAAGLVVKLLFWKHTRAGSGSTTSSATGIEGDVRLLEGPHTQANYLLREMGFTIARKHADKLRVGVFLFAFGVPFLTLAALSYDAAGWVAVAGFAALMVGVFMERWLFFAEARHVVTLYYGARAA